MHDTPLLEPKRTKPVSHMMSNSEWLMKHCSGKSDYISARVVIAAKTCHLCAICHKQTPRIDMLGLVARPSSSHCVSGNAMAYCAIMVWWLPLDRRCPFPPYFGTSSMWFIVEIFATPSRMAAAIRLCSASIASTGLSFCLADLLETRIMVGLPESLSK